MKNKFTAFTLVELIVVITILAILATIGFVSFSGYLAGTRDVNRIAQLKSMSDALELYRTKKDLPIPDDKVDVQASGTTIAYQGYIGANVLETIEYTEKGLDPKDKQYFTYYLTKDKKYFQLLSFLEEPNTDVVASISPFFKGSPLKGGGILNGVQAVDYSGRFPHVQGKKLGVLTNDENTPIQEILSITSSGYLDTVNTIDTYISYLTDENKITGSGAILKPLGLSVLNGKEYKSCKEIRDNEPLSANSDDTYYIRPEGYPLFQVYCDMTNDGGGWTRYVEIRGNYSWQDGVDCADRLERIDNDTLYCFVPHKMGKITEFMYVDNSGNSDVSNPYKTIVDKQLKPYSNAHIGVYETTIFDYMKNISEPEKEFVRFGINYKHDHSACGGDRHPGGMSKLRTEPYMNYDFDSTGVSTECSGPSSSGNNRELNAREGEFYVR